LGNDADGVPLGYAASAEYRGIEKYKETGYFKAKAKITVTEGTAGSSTWSVIATYVLAGGGVAATEPEEPETTEIEPEETPAAPPAPPAEDETTTGTGTKVEEQPSEILEEPVPQSGFSPEDQAKIDAQSGNWIQDLIDGLVPMGSYGVGGAWSLLSMFMSFAAVILAALAILGHIGRRRDAQALREEGRTDWRLGLFPAFAFTVVGVIFGILTLVSWLFLDDRDLPVTWLNKYSGVVIFLLVVTLVGFVLSRIRYRLPAEDAPEAVDEDYEVVPSNRQE
ncbi:MAG: hypothetical protein LBR00_01665, partial [Clostridiales Family XIII bacterium]|nr:hypothetical protein [Clostridiales Family XIII bacterium]